MWWLQTKTVGLAQAASNGQPLGNPLSSYGSAQGY